MKTTVFIAELEVTDTHARPLSGGAVEKLAAHLELAAHRAALVALDRFPVGSRVLGVGDDVEAEVVDHTRNVGPLAPYLNVRSASGARLIPVVDAYRPGEEPPTAVVRLPVTIDVDGDLVTSPCGSPVSMSELVTLAAHCRDVAHATLAAHVRERYPVGALVRLSRGEPGEPRPVLRVVGHRESGPYSPAVIVTGAEGRRTVQPDDLEPAPVAEWTTGT